MTALAVLLVVLAAGAYAAGAWIQHGAVQVFSAGRFSPLSQLRLLRDPRWLLGGASLATGAVLHVSALGLAPLSVVQPVGALALPITVLLNAKRRGARGFELRPAVVAAAALCTVSVAAFVVLEAMNATATRIGGEDELAATRVAALGVPVLASVGVLTRSKLRCLAFAAACGVAYGYVSLLMRGVVQVVGTDQLRPLPLVEIVLATVVGAWLLQHAHASGPPELVVACLTVVDPLVAVGLGIGLLGEADRVAPAAALGEIICAMTACAGVFALARHHPRSREQRGVASAVGGGDAGGVAGGMAGQSTDRPDGSTT
jgi:hypothetical protein